MHDVEAHDLLLIGNVKMGLVNGKELDSEFTGRVVIAEDKAGEPKIKLYQVWAVCSHTLKSSQQHLILNRIQHL